MGLYPSAGSFVTYISRTRIGMITDTFPRTDRRVSVITDGAATSPDVAAGPDIRRGDRAPRDGRAGRASDPRRPRPTLGLASLHHALNSPCSSAGMCHLNKPLTIMTPTGPTMDHGVGPSFAAANILLAGA